MTTPLSLIQASNGQVYILQNQQQTTTTSPTSTTTPTGPGTTSTTGIPAGTAQFFPTQMILATAADNSTLVLATNKLTSPTTLSTPTNWMQPLQSSFQPFPSKVLVDASASSKTISTVQLDIDLTKSKKTADIVTKALVASKVLKGC